MGEKWNVTNISLFPEDHLHNGCQILAQGKRKNQCDIIKKKKLTIINHEMSLD